MQAKFNKIVFNKSITLLGFMGCGKSSVGKELSLLMGIDFFDLDQLIVDAEGKSVPEIFNEGGENHFRLIEKKILKETLENKQAMILALGGGTPCYFDNMDLINNYSTSIYLQSKPKLLFGRLKQKKFKRPLIENLNDDQLIAFINSKLRMRRKFYMQANLKVRINTTSKEMAERIITRLKID